MPRRTPRHRTLPAPLYHRALKLTLPTLAALTLTTPQPAHAEIYRWDNNQLIPGTVGLWPAPGVNLSSLDLSYAHLNSASLQSAKLVAANLTAANLSLAQLTSANLTSANLLHANLSQTNLNAANLISANLTSARFATADLTSANFTGATIRNSIFISTQITFAQLSSTASFSARDLTGVFLSGNLSGWNLASQDLTSAGFEGCQLASTNFTSAKITHADFFGANPTFSQISSTASYIAHDLSGIYISGSLTGWNLSSQNLAGATMYDAFLTSANLTSADFTLADLRGSTGFTPVASTITRGTILTNNTVQPFTLNSGETFNVRPGPAVTILGNLTTSPNSTIIIGSGAGFSVTASSLTAASNTTFSFTLTTSSTSAPLKITSANGLTLNGGIITLTDNALPQTPQGYYKLIQYSGTIAGLGANSLTITTPAPTNMAYLLDTTHDPGFIDLHKVLLGDINADNIVDGSDFDIWFTHLQSQNPTYATGDLNLDGSIDGADFDLWFTHLQNSFGGDGGFTQSQLSELSNFLSPDQLGTLTVPEPATLSLLALTTTLLLTRRRK